MNISFCLFVPKQQHLWVTYLVMRMRDKVNDIKSKNDGISYVVLMSFLHPHFIRRRDTTTEFECRSSSDKCVSP